jgi:hypothetical protein
MAFPVVPIFALVFAGAALRRRKATGKVSHKKSSAIIVIQGKNSGSVNLELGEKLSIQFIEEPGEEWKMTDAPDGFLMGAAKVKWEPAPGERRLKAFDFEARREGKTRAEFVKYVEGGDPKGADCSKIDIFIKRRLS